MSEFVGLGFALVSSSERSTLYIILFAICEYEKSSPGSRDPISAIVS